MERIPVDEVRSFGRKRNAGLVFPWRRTSMELLRLIEELDLNELERLVRTQVIVLNAFDRRCGIVGLDDGVAVFALYLKPNFVTHVLCPISSTASVLDLADHFSRAQPQSPR